MNHVERSLGSTRPRDSTPGMAETASACFSRAIQVLDIACAMRLRPSEASVYASFLGSVPAEETEEEFAAAVEAMS